MKHNVVATQVSYSYEAVRVEDDQNVVITFTYIPDPRTKGDYFVVLSKDGSPVEVIPFSNGGLAMEMTSIPGTIPSDAVHRKNPKTYTLIFESENRKGRSTWVIYIDPKESPDIPSWDQIFTRS